VPVASEHLMTRHGIKLGDVQLTSFTSGSGAEVRADVEKVLRYFDDITEIAAMYFRELYESTVASRKAA